MNDQIKTTLHDQLIYTLFTEGLSQGLVTIAQILMNAAMLLERENHIGAAPLPT
ncbi:MAG: hypothetical protein ACK5LK_03335 [Chthoniobacterales bacterium]